MRKLKTDGQITKTLFWLKRLLPIVTFTSGYGTAEIKESGLRSNQINNVQDAFNALSGLLFKMPKTQQGLQTQLTDLQNQLTDSQKFKILQTEINDLQINTQLLIFKENSDYYSKMTECGKLHIYVDGTGRPMRFEKSEIT